MHTLETARGLLAALALGACAEAAPTPMTPSPTSQSAAPVVEHQLGHGVLDPKVIQSVVRASFGKFRACYEDGLRGNPNLRGVVGVNFVIGLDGSVTEVQQGGVDLPDPSVVRCILWSFKTLRFPSPAGGIVTVGYPIAFSPADEQGAPPKSP